MTKFIIEIILMVIFCEAITELICKAEIFEKPRNWFKSLSTFTNKLISCYYCSSVWSGAFSMLLFNFLYNRYILSFVLLVVFHRLSNYFHMIFSILKDYQIRKRIEIRNKYRKDDDLL